MWLNAGSIEDGRNPRSLSLPPRCASPDGRVPIQRRPAVTARLVGLPPVLTVPTTALRCGSICETVFENLFATHSEPSANASATGPLPTANIATTWLARGSSRETVPPRLLTTQAEPEPIASAVGPGPTWIVATSRCERESICATVPASWLADPDRPVSDGQARRSVGQGHRLGRDTRLSVDADESLVAGLGDPELMGPGGSSPSGPPRSGTVGRSCPFGDPFGLMSPLMVFATHTEPPATAISAGWPETGIRSTTALGRGADPRNDCRVRVGDPQRGADGRDRTRRPVKGNGVDRPAGSWCLPPRARSRCRDVTSEAVRLHQAPRRSRP